MINNVRVVLKAMGHFHPENNIENSFFEELDIGSDAGWISERTGINFRRSILTKKDILDLRHKRVTSLELQKREDVLTIAQMAASSWDKLKESFGDENITNNIDMIICGTSVPDYDIPANACTIAEKIGVECTAIDINSACSSFVIDVNMAAPLIKSGGANKIAVFNPERYSLRLNYNDRNTCVLFGDGCSVAIFEAFTDNDVGHVEGLELLDTITAGMPSKYNAVRTPVDDFFDQNGRTVQKFAITKTIESTRQILDKNNINIKDIAYFIGHQANLRMLTAAVDKLGIDRSKHLFNVENYGNQGGAGAPSILSQNWDKYKSGDLIVLTVVGSGLTWGSALFKKL